MSQIDQTIIVNTKKIEYSTRRFEIYKLIGVPPYG